MIRSVTIGDTPAICKIYNYYVVNSIVTFEEETISDDEMESRITSVLQDNLPWYVFEMENRIAGFAYAGKWNSRTAYRYSVESTVYVDPELTGRGSGKKLYAELIDSLKKKEIHSVIGGIALPNDASIILHEYFGFEKVAHFKEVGFKFGKWIDVGHWELII